MQKINTYLIFILIFIVFSMSTSCTKQQENSLNIDKQKGPTKVIENDEKMQNEIEQIVENKEEDNVFPIKTVTLIKATTSLNVREKEDYSSKIVGVMDKNDMLYLVNECEEFYETIYKNKRAFLNKKYCQLFKMEQKSEEIENVINVGYKLLGYPYVYGAQRYHWGNGKINTNFVMGDFDCSSLVQYMYFVGAGIEIGLTSREQSTQGVYVEKDQIKRGDLLFFTNSSRKNKTGIEKIGHVAMYLGDNYILHTASDFAVIEEISSLRWSYFLHARRFIF